MIRRLLYSKRKRRISQRFSRRRRSPGIFGKIRSRALLLSSTHTHTRNLSHWLCIGTADHQFAGQSWERDAGPFPFQGTCLRARTLQSETPGYCEHGNLTDSAVKTLASHCQEPGAVDRPEWLFQPDGWHGRERPLTRAIVKNPSVQSHRQAQGGSGPCSGGGFRRRGWVRPHAHHLRRRNPRRLRRQGHWGNRPSCGKCSGSPAYVSVGRRRIRSRAAWRHRDISRRALR